MCLGHNFDFGHLDTASDSGWRWHDDGQACSVPSASDLPCREDDTTAESIQGLNGASEYLALPGLRNADDVPSLPIFRSLARDGIAPTI